MLAWLQKKQTNAYAHLSLKQGMERFSAAPASVFIWSSNFPNPFTQQWNMWWQWPWLKLKGIRLFNYELSAGVKSSTRNDSIYAELGIRNCVDSFNNELMQWLKGCGTGKKLMTFKDFKSMVKLESYLDILKIRRQRKIYSKFRLS